MDVSSAYSRPPTYDELYNTILDSDGLQTLFPSSRLTKKAYNAMVEAFDMRLLHLRGLEIRNKIERLGERAAMECNNTTPSG